MSAPGINILHAFSTPIITCHLPDSRLLNRDLAALFRAREAEGDRYRKFPHTPTTQVNIFESEFNLFAWNDPPVVHLRAFCLDTLRRVVLELNEYSPEQITMLPKLKLQIDSWFHITRFGGYIGVHSHPMASWSGVYCVTPGEYPEAHPNSGLLRFLDARLYASMYLDPGNVRLKSPFAVSNFDFKLQEGSLLLFPSYLGHEVLPFFGRDERITVAFNCSFTRPEGKDFGFF